MRMTYITDERQSLENMLRFLSRFGASPKCEKEIFNKVRNCMKTRNLAFKFFGPKC